MEIEHGVAPLQDAHRIVAMAFDAGDDLFVERFGLGGHAERAVVHVTPGAARDLADLFGPERAGGGAVELFEGRERDVVDVHVEAHADRVGGDEEIDVAVLVELDLGVARAWG